MHNQKHEKRPCLVIIVKSLLNCSMATRNKNNTNLEEMYCIDINYASERLGERLGESATALLLLLKISTV